MIRVQPPKKKGHIAPEFAVGRLRPRTQHAIAIGFGIEQDLLDEKGRGFANRFTGSADRFTSPGLSPLRHQPRCEEELEHVIWQRS